MSALGYIVLACVVAGVLYCYFRPSFTLVLLMAFYPLKQLEMSYLAVFAMNSAYFNYIVFMGVCLGVLGNITRSREAFWGYGNKFVGLLLTLYCFALLAVLYTPSREWAMDRVRDGAPYWVMQILLLPLCFSSLADVRKAIAPTILACTLVVVLFLTNPKASFYAGRLTLDIGILGVGGEARGNPLATAQMGGHLALFAALMLPARAAWFMHLLRLAGVFLGLGIAVAAGSRGQLAMAIIVLVAFYPMARKVKDIKQFFLFSLGFMMMAGLCVVALSYFLGQNKEQANRWDLDRWSDAMTGRSWEALRLVDAWWDSPAHWVFGLGTNAFSGISGDQHSYAHNIFIEMLGELGLFGLTVFLVLLTWVIKMSRELFRTFSDDPGGRATAAVLLSQGAYLGLLALKQGTFVSIPEPWYIWVLIAKIAMSERRHTMAYYAQHVEHSEAWAGYEEAAAAYSADVTPSSTGTATS